MLRVVTAVVVTLAPAIALAGETPWRDLALGARARMISSDSAARGETTVGLEIELPEGAETYWRIPGEAGIPTTFDFSGTTGLTEPQIEWPYPEINVVSGMRVYVFHGHLVVPIRFAGAGDQAVLKAGVTLGVCTDICVPASASFELPITFGKPDAEQSVRLQMVDAQIPIAWDQPQDPFGAIGIDDRGLTIVDVDQTIDPDSIIANVGDPAILFGTPQKGPDGNLWTLPVLGAAGTKGLEGRPVQLTFTTPLGPYVVSRVIGAQK